MEKVKTAVLGATGMVGQRFVRLLEGHPWFEVAALVGSARSAGRPYGEACRWSIEGEMPEGLADAKVLGPDEPLDAPLVFSALPGGVAGPIEERLAAAGHVVCTNASAHRMDPDVPLLIPEVNPDHLSLIDAQRKRRGWAGAIVANPNCTATPVAMSLRPLLDGFGIEGALVVSMQALSGAGYPGVPSYDAVDNVSPIAGDEEHKAVDEPKKMLGAMRYGEIEPAGFVASAHCNRVPVLDGHLVCVSVTLGRGASSGEVADALRGFVALPQRLGLPSAPTRPVVVRGEEDRPQHRRDRDAGGGMAAVVGRVRPCPLLGHKFSALAHNTIRGAAGGSILNAELMAEQGYLA